jgi:hypothetical protein
MPRKLGDFAAPSNCFMREPIAQPDVAAEQYVIKPNLVSMVQQNQFGGTVMRGGYLLRLLFTTS